MRWDERRYMFGHLYAQHLYEEKNKGITLQKYVQNKWLLDINAYCIVDRRYSLTPKRVRWLVMYQLCWFLVASWRTCRLELSKKILNIRKVLLNANSSQALGISQVFLWDPSCWSLWFWVLCVLLCLSPFFILRPNLPVSLDCSCVFLKRLFNKMISFD